jgi:hypothetical protein
MSFLIAAGGTGQEIAAATLRLSYLSGVQPPETYVIDSDLAANESGKGRTRQQVVDQLHQWLTTLGPVAARFVKAVNPSELHREGQGVGAVTRLSDVFRQHGRMASDDEQLLSLLFTPEQLQITVNDGFHGHPAVGAMVVAVASQRGEWAALRADLGKAAEAAEGLRVLVAGSVNGGVGTATLPAVIRDLQPIRHAGRRVFVGGLFQLPWFQLKHIAQEQDAERPDVTPAMMDRNATCLVNGYVDQTMSQQLDTALLLGLPSQVDRASHGGSRQQETRHYLNLISGIHALTLLDQQESDRVFPGKGLVGMTLDETPSAQYGRRAGGPQFRFLTVDAFINVARGLYAFTDALIFETQTIEPSTTHQADVRAVLKALGTEHRRAEFRRVVHDLHRMHEEIWTWLCDSLHSKVGDNRADPPGMKTFERTETWWTDMRASPLRKTLRQSGGAFPPIGRRLLQRLGRFGVDTKSDGQTAAWTMVKHARERLLQIAGGS